MLLSAWQADELDPSVDWVAVRFAGRLLLAQPQKAAALDVDHATVVVHEATPGLGVAPGFAVQAP